MSLGSSSPETNTTLGECVRSLVDAEPGRCLFTRLPERTGAPQVLTASVLYERAVGVARALLDVARPGDRVLLLFPPGLDFHVAFLACALGGFIAVPAYPARARAGSDTREGRPDKNYRRLEGIVRDCAPRAALATRANLESLPMLPEESGLRNVKWIAADTVASASSADSLIVQVRPDDVAFLQYTSGSTSEPKGVVLTHRNILENQAVIAQKLGVDASSTMVSWLPVYHDMGLCSGFFLSLFTGCHSVLLAPLTFLMHPVRWLEAITRYRGTISGGPNFAFDLCVSRVDDSVVPQLDLSSLRALFSGAEPIRDETLRRFSAKFERSNFRYEQFYPCYGLAEATLFVSGGKPSEAPKLLRCDRSALGGGRVVGAAERSNDALTLVGCGNDFAPHDVRIVDPETRRERPLGEVGEVWVRCASAGQGYFGQEALSDEVFRARTESGEGPFLRTGDLGFVWEGELFIAGRLKDLVILNGVNYYPQDIEHIVESAHPALAENASAVFAVQVGSQERLGVAVELSRGVTDVAFPDIEESVQRALARALELRAHSVAVLASGALPRTSSGKIRRHACRAELERQLGGVAR